MERGKWTIKENNVISFFFQQKKDIDDKKYFGL
jgi:hypothetical protein